MRIKWVGSGARICAFRLDSAAAPPDVEMERVFGGCGFSLRRGRQWKITNGLNKIDQRKLSTTNFRRKLSVCPQGTPTDKVVEFGETFEDIQDGDTICVVWTTARTGLDKERTFGTFCLSEKEAREAARSMPIGTVFDGRFAVFKRLREIFLARFRRTSQKQFAAFIGEVANKTPCTLFAMKSCLKRE